MTVLSNTHLGSSITLRLEVLKSFTFNVKVKDHRGRPLDIGGTSFRFVAQDNRYPYDNFITKHPSIIEPAQGFVKFDFQAAELDMPSGEYPYVLVMTLEDGYSLVIMKGTLQLLDNPDVLAGEDVYDTQPASQGIEVKLRGHNVVYVRTGNVLPPGMNFFSDDEKIALDNLIDEMNQMKRQLGIS